MRLPQRYPPRRRHCEVRTVLQPVPLDETGLPLFRMLRPSAAKQPRGRVTLPPGSFVASLLAVTIPLERRPLVGGSQRWRNKGAPSKPFSKLLQKSRVLLQAFPNKSLAVLWDFKGLQGFQTSFDAFQIFRLGPPPFGRILPDFTTRFSRAATQIERILNLTDNPVFEKKYP